MDPIAHTLFGAALAETGLKRLSRYGTATLLIGANLPDIDVVAQFWGHDASLYARRGWTHGVLALVLLPLLLTAVVWLWHRWRGKGEGPPLRLGAVLGLSYLGVWSHPLLDWLNTYGVRLLMPFDGRWFYGDTLYIVDPWLWLMAAMGVVLARSARLPAKLGWVVLAVLTTALILNTDRPLAVKLLWLGGVAAIALLRGYRPGPVGGTALARVGLAALVVYVGTVYGLARQAEAQAAARFPTPLQVQSNPIPGIPFAHRVVLVYENLYRVIEADGQVREIPRQTPDPVVRQAMASDSIRGFITWMRFPYWEVEETTTGWIVRFRDLRYTNPDGPRSGIGYAEVTVPKA